MPRMTAPRTGVRVRMYRQGHGDCFLLAFRGRVGRRRPTVYVLIDCGYKPKSEVHDQKIDTIAADIIESTGGFVDVAMVTHEHQDHGGSADDQKGKQCHRPVGGRWKQRRRCLIHGNPCSNQDRFVKQNADIGL